MRILNLWRILEFIWQYIRTGPSEAAVWEKGVTLQAPLL
jgi:hypothetical protein